MPTFSIAETDRIGMQTGETISIRHPDSSTPSFLSLCLKALQAYQNAGRAFNTGIRSALVALASQSTITVAAVHTPTYRRATSSAFS